MRLRQAMFEDQQISNHLRLTILLGLALWAGYKQSLTIEIIGIFLFAVIWSFFLSVSDFSSRGWLWILGDSLIASGLYFFSGTLTGDMVWAAILPISSAAMYYGLPGGIISAIGFSLLFGALAITDLESSSILQEIWMPSILLGLSGAGLGFWGHQVSIQSSQSRAIEKSKVIDEAKFERERNQALFEISATLGNAVDFEEVLELALDIYDRILNDSPETKNKLISAVLLFEKEGLNVAAARRFSYKDLEIIFPAEKGLLAKVIEDGEAMKNSDPREDVELKRISAMQNSNSAYCTPLRVGLEIFGVLLFAHSEEAYFTDDRITQLETVAQLLVTALQNAQLTESLNAEKLRISHIEEQARRQLARTLHDGPTQSIAAIAMRVNLARRLASKDAKAAADELFKVEELARRTTKEIRHMLFTLRPEILDREGLAAAIADLANQNKDSFDQEINLEIDPKSVERMDLGKQGVVFSISVEGLDNARRHAEAKNVWIRLNRTERDIVLLEIEDDGVGFDLDSDQVNPIHGDQSGLRNMRDRVELLNGRMLIKSADGEGCYIQVWVPLNEKAASRMRLGL
jgi:signal transduction histidine kinase